MSSRREVVESPLEQGEDERIAYPLTTTPWSSSPTSPACVLKLVDPSGDMTDVSSTNLSGAPSVVGDVITSPLVISLIANNKYRLEFKWTTAGNTWESYLIIFAKV